MRTLRPPTPHDLGTMDILHSSTSNAGSRPPALCPGLGSKVRPHGVAWVLPFRRFHPSDSPLAVLFPALIEPGLPRMAIMQVDYSISEDELSSGQVTWKGKWGLLLELSGIWYILLTRG
jgi:hypothetical protein